MTKPRKARRVAGVFPSLAGFPITKDDETIKDLQHSLEYLEEHFVCFADVKRVRKVVKEAMRRANNDLDARLIDLVDER